MYYSSFKESLKVKESVNLIYRLVLKYDEWSCRRI